MRKKTESVSFSLLVDVLGGGQHLERPNIERPIFRNFEISNIKIAKNELFDYFIYEFVFYYDFFKLLEHSKYLTIFPNFLNC